jgi:hypothetical protein
MEQDDNFLDKFVFRNRVTFLLMVKWRAITFLCGHRTPENGRRESA